MNNKAESIKELRTIPGVGRVVAEDLWQMGFKAVKDLCGQDPEILYVLHNDLKGSVQDICMLYTFRCAVYFAETEAKERDPEKLKWWNWMDEEKTSSQNKDRWIRKAKNLAV